MKCSVRLSLVQFPKQNLNWHDGNKNHIYNQISELMVDTVNFLQTQLRKYQTFIKFIHSYSYFDHSKIGESRGNSKTGFTVMCLEQGQKHVWKYQSEDTLSNYFIKFMTQIKKLKLFKFWEWKLKLKVTCRSKQTYLRNVIFYINLQVR